MNGAITAPEHLTDDHDISEFDSGVVDLDDWLKRRALANEASRASRTFVITDGKRVIGYCALATGAVAHAGATGRVRRNMSDPIPVMVLARLAVDRQYQGKGLGSSLLRDALLRTLRAADIAGIRASPVDPMTLMVTLADVEKSLNGLALGVRFSYASCETRSSPGSANLSWPPRAADSFRSCLAFVGRRGCGGDIPRTSTSARTDRQRALRRVGARRRRRDAHAKTWSGVRDSAERAAFGRQQDRRSPPRRILAGSRGLSLAGDDRQTKTDAGNMAKAIERVVGARESSEDLRNALRRNAEA